jgi:ABC-type branched-subunit amino acid transport system substrate-binding protein
VTQRRGVRVALPVLLVIVLLSVGVSGCGAALRTVKIALVAPFEGRQRAVGYAAFPALRLALRDAMAAAPNERIQITFVAYDDGGDPAKAARVARAAALDPEVIAVIGHLTLTPTLAAMRVYTEAGLTVLAPGVAPEDLPADALLFRMGPSRARLADGFDAPLLEASPGAQQALARFTEISLGPAPERGSIVAHDATTLLIAAIRADMRTNGAPTRAGVARALRTITHTGLLGTITFDADGVWRDAPVFPR